MFPTPSALRSRRIFTFFATGNVLAFTLTTSALAYVFGLPLTPQSAHPLPPGIHTDQAAPAIRNIPYRTYPRHGIRDLTPIKYTIANRGTPPNSSAARPCERRGWNRSFIPANNGLRRASSSPPAKNAAAAARIVAAGAHVYAVEPIRASLEERFLQLLQADASDRDRYADVP